MNELDLADVFECGLCGACGDSLQVAHHLGDVHQVLRDEETLVGLPMRMVHSRDGATAGQDGTSALMVLTAHESTTA